MRIGVEWEPRDLWRGFYWDIKRSKKGTNATFHLYICIVPAVVFHLEKKIKHDIGPWGWLLLADSRLCRAIDRNTPWHFWIRGRFYKWAKAKGRKSKSSK